MLEPLDPAAWSPRLARHLLNRAGFGVPHARAAALAALPHAEAVAALVDYSAAPDPLPEADFVGRPVNPREFLRGLGGLSRAERDLIVQDKRAEERAQVERLKAWWLMRMHRSPRPLEEKLTLFWHGHFAASAQKVNFAWYNLEMNRLFRTHAAGNFKALATAVGQSPAMLVYLDQRQSHRNHPNENWARELMELFVLGKGHYTEADIKESARAFTGWTLVDHAFAYRPEMHDPGAKTFLGRTGDFDGWNILDILFEQPAAASFVCAKLWRYFAGAEPAPETVEALAATLRAGGFEIAPVLRALFMARAFYAPEVVGAQIKSPAQFVVQLCEDLEIDEPPYLLLAQNMKSLGQDLFYPPNVKGWDGNRAWINANALLQRYNLPPRIAVTARAMQALREDGAAMGGADMDAMAPAEMRGLFQRAERGFRARMQAETKEKIAALPDGERQRARDTLRNGAPADKLALAQRLGLPLPPELEAVPTRLFDELGAAATAGACADALAGRLIAAPLGPSQRAAIARALGAEGPDAPLDARAVPPAQRNAALHLITSMAEYQLC